MRDFEWTHPLWAVVKNDGTFAGIPCLSYEEARELAKEHENSRIFTMALEIDNLNFDMNFDPEF